eukprot:EG_transcript_332
MLKLAKVAEVRETSSDRVSGRAARSRGPRSAPDSSQGAKTPTRSSSVQSSSTETNMVMQKHIQKRRQVLGSKVSEPKVGKEDGAVSVLSDVGFHSTEEHLIKPDTPEKVTEAADVDEAQPIPYPDDAPRVENAVEEEPIEGSTVLDAPTSSALNGDSDLDNSDHSNLEMAAFCHAKDNSAPRKRYLMTSATSSDIDSDEEANAADGAIVLPTFTSDLQSLSAFSPTPPDDDDGSSSPPKLLHRAPSEGTPNRGPLTPAPHASKRASQVDKVEAWTPAPGPDFPPSLRAPRTPQERRLFFAELLQAAAQPDRMLLRLAAHLPEWLAALAGPLDEGPALAGLLAFAGSPALLQNRLLLPLARRVLGSLVAGSPSVVERLPALLRARGPAGGPDQPACIAGLCSTMHRLLGVSLSPAAHTALRELLAAAQEVATAHEWPVAAVEQAQRQLEMDAAPELEVFPGLMELWRGPDHPESAMNPTGPLRPIRCQGPYDSVAEYLRTHFELMKADCFTEMVRYIAQRFHNAPKNPLAELQSLYTHVELLGFCALGRQAHGCHVLRFQCARRQPPLADGALLCLSTDDFVAEVWWAVAEVCHSRLVEAGMAGVVFLSGEPTDLQACVRRRQLEGRPEACVMVEGGMFFLAYRPVLESLRYLRDTEDLPFTDQLVHGSNATAAPRYKLLRPPGAYVTVLDTLCEQTSFDPSQEAALRAIADSDLLLIQGPPGTGKSFVGSRIAEAITRFRNLSDGTIPPTLVITYKNHSLDEFLTDCLGFTNKVVRIGGRSRCAELEKYNLKALVKTPGLGPKQRRQLDKLRHWLQECSQALRQVRLTADVAERHMTAAQREAFGPVTPEALRQWLPVDRSPFPLFEALDALRDAAEGGGASPRATRPDPGRPDDGTPWFYVDRAAEEANSDDLLKAEAGFDCLRTMAVPLPGVALGQRAVGAGDPAAAHSGEDGDPTGSLADQLWSLSPGARRCVAEHWLQAECAEQLQQYRELCREYDALLEGAKAAAALNKLAVLSRADIVGLTTTGCAMNHELLRQLRPAVLIVEEAAEVLESQVLCCLTKGLQQIIMIGDHKQLQPAVEVQRLAEHCHLTLSLFERLCNNGLPHFMLARQRRMVPEVSALVAPLYPGLEDCPTIASRQFETTTGPQSGVPGFSTPVFFWAHDEPEQPSGQSQMNRREQQMALDLVAYLQHSGVQSHQITILSPYQAQVKGLERALRSPLLQAGFRPVDVQTVDSFQGDENDVIILSLVRTQMLTKFIQRENRMCVALSRARFALFILGCPGLLARVPHWQQTLELLRARPVPAVGEDLPLVCCRHPEVRATANSCTPFPHLFCDHPCLQPFRHCANPGHRCPNRCHTGDHEECPLACMKELPCGHTCLQPCPAPCLCTTTVFVSAPCSHAVPGGAGRRVGHYQKVLCGQAPVTCDSLTSGRPFCFCEVHNIPIGLYRGEPSCHKCWAHHKQTLLPLPDMSPMLSAASSPRLLPFNLHGRPGQAN